MGLTPARRLAVKLVGTAFFAVMGTVLTVAPFPAYQRIVAPLLCPEGATRSMIVVTWSSPGPGESTMTSDLVCVDAKGRPERVRNVTVVAVIFAGWLLALPAAWPSLRALAALRSP